MMNLHVTIGTSIGRILQRLSDWIGPGSLGQILLLYIRLLSLQDWYLGMASLSVYFYYCWHTVASHLIPCDPEGALSRLVKLEDLVAENSTSLMGPHA